jgi:MFS family permease
MITLATYGVGMLIGFWFAGKIAERYAIGQDAHNWKNIWLVPAGIAFIVLLIFLTLFKEPKKQTKENPSL